MKRRTKFTILAMLAILFYTAAVLILAYHGCSVPDSLTVAYFSAWTIELGYLFGIKIKDRGDSND